MPDTSKEEVQLRHLETKANQVLFTASALFPFQLVPDKITIDASKITIEYRNILHTDTIHTILLEDIFDIEVAYVLFLASVAIKGKLLTYTLPFLRVKDALRIKEIVVGLQAAQRENIDLLKINPKTLPKHLAEIGRPPE